MVFLMQNQRIPPSPIPGLETKIVALIQQLVADLPTGAAELSLQRVPGHPEWPNPYFAVSPRNPKAAAFKGVVVENDLELTIGKFAAREFPGFARGAAILKGLGPEEEFRWIWQSVIAGGFTEDVYYNRRGKMVAAISKVPVENVVLTFSYGGRLVSSLVNRKKETVVYERY